MSTNVLQTLWLTRGMTVHLTECRLTWKYIWGDLDWFREWTDLCSLAWLDRGYRVPFCSLQLLGNVWTMQLGCPLLPSRHFLFSFGLLVALMLLVVFHLASWVMVKDALCRHVSKYPAYVTHDCNPAVYLPEVDGNWFGISTKLKTPGAEWLHPYGGRNIRVPENIAQMQSLQANHNTVVKTCMKLLQWLHTVSSFSHGPLSSVHMGGFLSEWLFYLEQLVGPDHHLVYFNGAAVFLKSEIPLFPDNSFLTTL